MFVWLIPLQFGLIVEAWWKAASTKRWRKCL